MLLKLTFCTGIIHWCIHSVYGNVHYIWLSSPKWNELSDWFFVIICNNCACVLIYVLSQLVEMGGVIALTILAREKELEVVVWNPTSVIEL